MLYLAYTRKSIIDDPTTPSPELQRANMEKWAATNNATLEHYQDLDISGRIIERDGWQKFLSRIPDPDVDGVVAVDTSKFYRNRIEFGNLLNLLEEHDKKFVTLSMPSIDPKTAAGRLILGIKADVDEYQSRVTSERMKNTIKHLTEDKGRHWGRVPFGCDRDQLTKHLIPTKSFYYFNPTTNQTQVATVADIHNQTPRSPAGCDVRYYYDSLLTIYRLSSQDISPAQIAIDMNNDGWRMWKYDRVTPCCFTRNTTRSILNRWHIYAGNIKPSVPGDYASIIPDDLINTTVTILNRRANNRSPGKSQHIYLLTGCIFCGSCGARLSGLDTRGWVYYCHSYGKYACPEKMIRRDVAEQYILDRLITPIKSHLIDDVKQELITIYQTAAGQDQNAIEAAQQLEMEQNRLERLTELYIDGHIERTKYNARRAELHAHIEALQQKSASMPNTDTNALLQSVDRLTDNLSQLANAPPATQKDIIRSMIERIEVTDKQINRIVYQPWCRVFFDL